MLLEQTRRIPANVRITVPEGDILLDTLISQINNTVTLPDSEAQVTLLREGRLLYARLLAGQITPAEAAQILSDAMQPANPVE
jgi:hypothetical protein